ncbi:formimidoylglutamate deiminase [Arthrobacter sp. zg-Y1171]|uniref:formimidoylglutamate deiminase n=1 Tax=Arthrobacter sp. zg-Y1171 TaxID=2964610 RepID=UPI0021056205|nr:formimidoylglutamate deiminase [Arthrobacter sp. zg-Y1171]MCQ1996161.1 formimidoylglutamate deiminase [Arthrobacter sp. zg-Y1171]UWX82781.1 formimidoylglutamate deiminase [Arthrobacter sp. zg-Y1171]
MSGAAGALVEGPPTGGAAVWCEAGWYEGSIRAGIRLTVDSAGEVTAAVPGTDAGPGDLVLSGVVYPAAANAHSHAFHRVLRGRTHTDGDFWSWREQMYSAAGTLTPELYEQLATAVFAEMVVSGYTSVAEFHYVHHVPDGSAYPGHAMELALARAAVAAGIRLTLLDTCYLSGGFGPGGSGTPLDARQQRFGDADADAWLERFASLQAAVGERFDPEQVSVGAALHSIRAVPEAALARIAERLPAGIPLHIHLSEQPQENADCLAATGLTPTGLLHRHGLLGPRLSAVHATHLTDADIALLGQAGATAVFCPTTEADLADGLGPAGALRNAGAALALGSDQHAVVDPWLEMRALEYGERMRTGRRGAFTPAELHAAASDAGTAAQARTAPGLEPGKACDLMAVDPHSLRTTGSRPDQLAFSATAADVTAVVVGGRLRARNGSHTSLGNPATLLREAIAAVDSAAAPMDKTRLEGTRRP